MSDVRALMIARSDQRHPLKALGGRIEEWLPEVAFDTSEENAALRSLDRDRHALCLLCATVGELTVEEEGALIRFADQGGGLLGIHSCTAVPEAREAYIGLIGGRFVRHSPYHEFPVKVAAPAHPVTAGVTDFAVQDELYVLDREPTGAEVLATADWEGRVQPMVYAKRRGESRICYVALGHDAVAHDHPAFRRLVTQGAEWAAGVR